MKKRILGTLAAILVLAMIIPVSGVAMAQSESTSDVAPESRPTLVIKSPDVVRVGQPVTITVVERHTGRPVSRVGVWAVHVEDGNSIEARTVLAEQYGYFIGWTDQNGEVVHRFRAQGRYVLATVKDGFMPGFAKITVKSHKALAIKAPGKARIGQPVTISVFDSNNGEPVPQAGVWAINVKDVTTETNMVEAYEELARERGYFIGWTDQNGEVNHRFRLPGRYILVAVKSGYAPGLARIEIVNLQLQKEQALRTSKATITNKSVSLRAGASNTENLDKENQ